MKGIQFLAHNNMLMSHVCAVLLSGIIDHSVRQPACALASAIKALKDGSVIDVALADQLIIALASSTESAWKRCLRN